MGSALSCGWQGKRTKGHWRGEMGVDSEICGGLLLISGPVLSAFHRFFSLCNQRMWCWVSIIDQKTQTDKSHLFINGVKETSVEFTIGESGN